MAINIASKSVPLEALQVEQSCSNSKVGLTAILVGLSSLSLCLSLSLAAPRCCSTISGRVLTRRWHQPVIGDCLEVYLSHKTPFKFGLVNDGILDRNISKRLQAFLTNSVHCSIFFLYDVLCSQTSDATFAVLALYSQ